MQRKAPLEAARAAEAGDEARLDELRAGALADLLPARGGAVLAALNSRLPAPPVVVGTLDGQVVGYVAARVEELLGGERLGVIQEVYVEPDARGVGVGEAMMEAVTAWCRGVGCTALDGSALPGDRTAKAFFESHGFTARLVVMHRRLLPGSSTVRKAQGEGK